MLDKNSNVGRQPDGKSAKRTGASNQEIAIALFILST